MQNLALIQHQPASQPGTSQPASQPRTSLVKFARSIITDPPGQLAVKEAFSIENVCSQRKRYKCKQILQSANFYQIWFGGAGLARERRQKGEVGELPWLEFDAERRWLLGQCRVLEFFSANPSTFFDCSGRLYFCKVQLSIGTKPEKLLS